MSLAVAYLGPSGTFTHQAVLTLLPDATARPLESQVAALDALASGEVDRAVLPIDNSVNGVVVPTLDGLLARPDLGIVDSVVLPISFTAFTPDAAVDPTVVVSHPHALAQCRTYVEGLGVPAREATSTAAACRDLAPGEIGIGPAVCGRLYPLVAVAEAVEDIAAAYTQFALVSSTADPTPAAGADGLLVSLQPSTNTPGLLRRLLGVLEDRDINMANLVTRPVPTAPGIYTFLLHLAGDVTPGEFARMQAAWAGLGAQARSLGRISPLAELVGQPTDAP